MDHLSSIKVNILFLLFMCVCVKILFTTHLFICIILRKHWRWLVNEGQTFEGMIMAGNWSDSCIRQTVKNHSPAGIKTSPHTQVYTVICK